jgi:hypothetical protein
MTTSLNLERRAGIEPANTGFADLRVSHFATGAYETIDLSQQKPTPINCLLNIKKPTAPCGGWVVG